MSSLARAQQKEQGFSPHTQRVPQASHFVVVTYAEFLEPLAQEALVDFHMPPAWSLNQGLIEGHRWMQWKNRRLLPEAVKGAQKSSLFFIPVSVLGIKKYFYKMVMIIFFFNVPTWDQPCPVMG